MKKIKYILLSLVGLAATTSCEKMFELERPETVPFASVNDLASTVPAPYTTLFSKGWATPAGIATLYQESNSDIVMMNPYSADGEFFTYNDRAMNSTLMSKTDQLFDNCYTTITLASDPLTMIEEAEASGKDLFNGMTETDQMTLDRIAGELYFIRGLAYWYLSRGYMPPYSIENSGTRYIPLRTTVIYDPDVIKNPYLGTMQEVYETMLSDFKKSKEKLRQFGAENRRGYPSTYAASQMLMRVHFIMGLNEAIGAAGGHKAAAIEECDYIINSNEYTLTGQDPIRAFNRNALAEYTNASDNDNAKEVVFDLEISQINGGVLVSSLCRMTLAGLPNHTYSKALLPDVLATMDDPTWSNGLRNYTEGEGTSPDGTTAGIAGGLNLVKRGKNAVIYWNPNTIQDIGWATTNDPTDLTSYVPSAEAKSDKRFLQLYEFLKGNPTPGVDISTDASYPDGIYEKFATFSNIGYNVFWSNKYFRGRHPYTTTIPLLRLPEVYLTRASLNPSTATADVNVVRERAGLTPLSAVTEVEIEKERIKEYAFENGDRITYLNAMKRDITANGRVALSNYNVTDYDPMAGTEIPNFAYPYNTFWMNMPADQLDYMNK